MVRLLHLGLLLGLAVGHLAAQEKIIVDTDSGFFGDDGAAMVMLLRAPQQVKILGVTVVSGNVWSRQGAEYMFHILGLAGHQEIPLYLGANMPLKHTLTIAKRAKKSDFIGAFGESARVQPPFGGKFTARTPEREEAADFIIRTVEADPGNVTILAIGPMTNVAIALRKRPEIAAKIKRLVFMGGSLGPPGDSPNGTEFNFWFDPEAANEVLRSPIREKIMFGLDICNHAPLGKAQFDELIAVKTPVTELLAEDFGNRFPGFNKNPKASAYIWDSLAAGYLIDPGFVTKRESRPLMVETALGKTYGVSRESKHTGATPVQVMLDLDYPRLFALYKKLLTAK